MQDKFLQFRDYFQANKQSFFANRKRSIIILLLVVLLPIGVIIALQQTIFNPHAGKGRVGLSLSTDSTDKKAFGKIFPVNVSLYNEGVTIAGVGVKLEYDPTTVEPANAPAKQGCYTKGAVQVCPAKDEQNRDIEPFPFMPKDPVVDANAGTIAFSTLSYDEAAHKVTEAFSSQEMKNFATVYFKSKLPGNTDIRILNNGPEDTRDDSNVAGKDSAEDYLVTTNFKPAIKQTLAVDIEPPIPFGIYDVKEIAGNGVIAYAQTLNVEGWAVSQSSTVDRYVIYLNGNPIVELQKSDPRVVKVAHPEAGVCGGAEAQANYPDCANGANVGFKIAVTKDELESGGVNFSDPNIETRPQKLEVKVYSKITQGDEFEGALPYGSLQGPKQLSFFLDDPANKGNPAQYAVNPANPNANQSFIMTINRPDNRYVDVGLVITKLGDSSFKKTKRLEPVPPSDTQYKTFRWNSNNALDGEDFSNGTYIFRLYGLCTYHDVDVPVGADNNTADRGTTPVQTVKAGAPQNCDGAGLKYEPYALVIGGGGAAPTSGAGDNRAPAGAFDGVDNNSCTAFGWAYDPDTTDPIKVHVYRDGAVGAGGIWTAEFIANKPKGSGEVIPDNSRFNDALPAEVRDGHPHTLYLYGIDPLPNKPFTLLGGSPKTITCPAS